MQEKRPLQSIPDDELLHSLGELICQSRRAEADIVAHIAEVEERRLYAREAFPSMFAYCMDVLHLSEAEAYLRIWASRASRRHPMLLTMLADGRLHLTAIVRLAPHLTIENKDGLLERATYRSKRQILELIAEISPRQDVPATLRKLPGRSPLPTPGRLVVPNREDAPILELGPDPMRVLGPDRVGAVEAPPFIPAAATPTAVSAPRVFGSVSALSASPSVVEPLSPGRYKVQFTASSEFRDKLERLRALLGSPGPEADLAAVIEQAVTEKLERLEARRFARTRAPRKGPTQKEPSRGALAATQTQLDSSPASRYIHAAVRRAVCLRDGNRCRYVDEHARRCKERDQLQFHHRHPFGLGGDHGVDNIWLMCRAHNDYLAECDYGREAMARHRRPAAGAAAG